jgi:hypothetical protein
MIWAILAAVGVPLWLCAVGILTLVMRNRALRARPGNVAVRVRPQGKSRWMPGHGLWVNDVFAYRGSPAAWKEGLFWVTAASERPADAEERKHLRRIGDEPVIATLTVDDAGTTRRIDVAARASDARTLRGPYFERAHRERDGGELMRAAPGSSGGTAITRVSRPHWAPDMGWR